MALARSKDRCSPPDESTWAPSTGTPMRLLGAGRGSNRGPVCHAFLVGAVFVMSDLELPIRGRTYREPEGAHSVVVRGRDIDAALQHAAARDDCRAIAVIGLPTQDPDLTV